MAGKPKNRLELRRQYEAAEPLDPMEDSFDDTDEVEDDEAEERKSRAKKKVAAKSKAKPTKATKPAARVRVVWAVVSDAFKTVATFEYSQKEAAEAKAAELTAKGKGTHFVQRVKEAMSDNAPGLGASIPREAPPKNAVKAEAARPADDEETDDEDEDDQDDDDYEEDE